MNESELYLGHVNRPEIAYIIAAKIVSEKAGMNGKIAHAIVHAIAIVLEKAGVNGP